MRCAFKFRLYPNVNQSRELASVLETHRRLYNDALAQRKEAWEGEKRGVRFDDQYKHFAVLRNAQIKRHREGGEGPFWYASIAAVSMRDTLKRLDVAFQNFFRRVKTGQQPGYPRFRGRDRFDSIPFDNYNAGCALLDPEDKVVLGHMLDGTDLHKHHLRLFGVGNVRIELHRPIRGLIKTVTVKREADHWYVAFSCDLGPVTVEPSTNPPIGVDVGLKSFLTTSEGEHEPNPRYLKKELPELRRQARSLSRKLRGGKNRRKQRKRVAKLHARIKNLRKEHHHQTALRLVRRYGFIAVERLDIQGMLEDHRFNRSIADAGWYSFVSVLHSKAERAGVQVVEVDPRGTTQQCSRCGETVHKDLTVRQHNCPHCGLSLDRDHNAALNILARARLARIGPAEDNVDQQVKRPPRSLSSVQTPLQPEPSREGDVLPPSRGVQKRHRSRKGPNPLAQT